MLLPTPIIIDYCNVCNYDLISNEDLSLSPQNGASALS